MAEQRNFHILCVGDSRLAHMQTPLNNNMRNFKFSCYVFSGATLGQIAYQLRLLLDQVSPSYYDYIVVFAGICDLTLLQKHPRREVKLAYHSVESTVENFERLFALFRDTVNLFTDIPIFYTTIPGVHLNFYSCLDSTELYEQQMIMDISIPLINIIIKRVSILHNRPTIDVARNIHRSRGHQGKYRTKYGRLYDGCHPTDTTRQQWVSEILKTITNFVYTV